MELLQKRNEFSDVSTISNYFIDGTFECFMLEDVDRGFTKDTPIEIIKETKEKFPSACAIPYGRYEVLITYSNKFGIHYPLINNVLGYLGVRIHRGYNQISSAGCTICGQKKIKDAVLKSKEAFYSLFEKMLIYKTNTETAKQLIQFHKEHKSKEFSDLYEKEKNDKKIFLTIEKDVEQIRH